MVERENKVLNFTVLIEQDEDGIYVAKVPDIIGCYTQGKTVGNGTHKRGNTGMP